MQIPLILTLEVRMKSEIFWFNRIPPKQRVNEQDGIRFLIQLLALTLLKFVIRNVLFCFIQS